MTYNNRRAKAIVGKLENIDGLNIIWFAGAYVHDDIKASDLLKVQGEIAYVREKLKADTPVFSKEALYRLAPELRIYDSIISNMKIGSYEELLTDCETAIQVYRVSENLLWGLWVLVELEMNDEPQKVQEVEYELLYN